MELRKRSRVELERCNEKGKRQETKRDGWPAESGGRAGQPSGLEACG
jgi:hypothetical protein